MAQRGNQMGRALRIQIAFFEDGDRGGGKSSWHATAVPGSAPSVPQVRK